MRFIIQKKNVGERLKALKNAIVQLHLSIEKIQEATAR